MSVDSCVILCGGASSRLKSANGESKIFLPLGEKSLVAHNFAKMSEIFGSVFIACKGNQVDLIEKSLDCHAELLARLAMTKSSESTLRKSSDSRKNQSDIFIIESPNIFAPIVGIISALSKLQNQKVFFISCDCPFVSRFVVQSLCDFAKNYDIVFAKDSHKIHPLIAVWSANLLPLLRDFLKKGDFRLQNIIDKARSKALSFDKSAFFNINTQEDYDIALKMQSNAQILSESHTQILG